MNHHPSPSDGGDLDTSNDNDIYVEDDDGPVTLPNDSDYYDTDDGRQSGRDSDTRTDDEAHDLDSEDDRGRLSA
jgi:hypothetical protein